MGTSIYTVNAPLMGTFYRAANPDEAPMVAEGQLIEASQAVGVIESMKIFTELRADQGGVVRKILVENEEVVMKNQALLEIEVADDAG